MQHKAGQRAGPAGARNTQVFPPPGSPEVSRATRVNCLFLNRGAMAENKPLLYTCLISTLRTRLSVMA